jgi:ABC-type lipoprotein export system ATPase subunit
MAGAAAMMFLLEDRGTRYNAGFLLGVKAFTAAVLGGIGNLRGALLGGFVLGVAESYGSAIFGSNWKDVVAFSLLVLILLFRPTGLLGESLLALGLNIVVGYGRPARPRLRGVLRRRRVHRGGAHHHLRLGRVGEPAPRHRPRLGRGGHPGRADAASPRRLPGHRHPRLRRDRPASSPRTQIFGIIGPNGAGKTTLFNCVTGVFEPDRGEIELDGDVDRRASAAPITEAGVARTFQNIRLFPNMTALENVMVGADARHARAAPAPLSSPRSTSARSARQGRGARCSSSSASPPADDLARNLPYGDQRRLEIARALATEPKLLLLDEPAAGMNPRRSRRSSRSSARSATAGSRSC